LRTASCARKDAPVNGDGWVPMTLLTAVAAVFLALLAASCENRWSASPTAPTLIPSETSPAATTVRWNLTTTITSITGSRGDCFSPIYWGTIGTPFHHYMFPLTITRSAESISLVVPDGWSDPYGYTGIVVGQDFTAGGGYDYSYTCSGSPPTRSEVVWEGHVSGRFSSDGSSLTAKEVWSYRFPSREGVTVHIDWTATRQDEGSSVLPTTVRFGNSRRD
jgi:hypothetical protein